MTELKLVVLLDVSYQGERWDEEDIIEEIGGLFATMATAAPKSVARIPHYRILTVSEAQGLLCGEAPA